jgi:outer membrane protein assembly factor BamB
VVKLLLFVYVNDLTINASMLFYNLNIDGIMEKRKNISHSIAKLAFVIILLSIFNIMPVVAQHNSAEWSQWRGPDRDGVSKEEIVSESWPVKGLDLLWKKKAGNGFSGISISNGKIITAWDEGDSQYLLCMNSISGDEVWRFKIGKSFKSNWGNGPRSTPAISGDLVYIVSTEGVLYALDFQSGKTIWQRNLVTDFDSQLPVYGYSCSPLVDDKNLYLEIGGKTGYSFGAFNKKTGELAWHVEDDLISYSSPIEVTVSNIRQIVYLSADGLVSLSPEDGRKYWRYTWNSRCPSTGVPVNSNTPVFIAPDKIYISGGFGTVIGASVIQIKEENEGFVIKTIWKNNNMKNLINTSVFYKNHIYGFDDKILKCIDVKTGQEKWMSKKYARGSLIVIDGYLVVLGENGELGLIHARSEQYNEISNVQVLKPKSWTGPSYAHGKLYLRNHEEILCLDLSSS